MAGPTGGSQARSSHDKGATRTPRGEAAGRRPGGDGKAGRSEGALSPLVIWGGLALVAVAIAIVVVLGLVRDRDRAAVPVADETPVAVSTAGTYDQLVQRANGYYDQGAELFSQGDVELAAEKFAAASQIYGAAWDKQPGDPNVGTDWATSLFYSGDIESALATVDMVIASHADFQPAHFNRGNFLAHQSRAAEQQGDESAAEDLRELAKRAFEKAESLDPDSEIGRRSAEAAAAL